jgi:hypothetical protein
LFTVIAIFCSIFGVALVARGKQGSVALNIGGLLSIVALILWVVVALSLFVQTLQWLWEHAP